MKTILCFILIGVLSSCVDFTPWDPEDFPPTQDMDKLQEDLAVIRLLLKENGIPEADSVSYERPLGILQREPGDELPLWEKIVLAERGLREFKVIPEVKRLNYNWKIDLSDNRLASVPGNIGWFDYAWLKGNRICDTSGVQGRRVEFGAQVCP